jgi:hypothetical protein
VEELVSQDLHPVPVGAVEQLNELAASRILMSLVRPCRRGRFLLHILACISLSELKSGGLPGLAEHSLLYPFYT